MAPNGNQHEHYNTHEYAGDRASDTYRVMQRMPDEDRSTRSELQVSITESQATELAPDVRMGDDRAIGDTPNWQGFTSQQLYDFATKENTPTSADTLGRGFTDGGNRLAEAANGLFEAVTALSGAWTGVAADSARAALAPLAQAAGQTGQTAQMMGVQMSRQSVAATEVRKLPPPQDFDQQQSLNAMVTGGPAAMQADLKAQKDAADAVKREQITYLDAYTQAMSSVDAQTPSFVPPPTDRINPEAGGDARITGSPVSVPDSGSQFTGRTSTGGPTGGMVGAAPGSSDGSASFGPDGSLENGDLTIPGTLPGTSTAGYTPGGSPVSTPTTTGMGPGFGGGGGSAVPAAGAGGFGGAFGNFGGAGAGGAGVGQGGAGAGGAGAGQGGNANAGPRGGMTPTGMSPTAGGVGGRGAGAGAGGMGAGGRRADGEDDDEHERPSYLLEGDPESAFGSDQMTAPSVIGDDGDD